MRWPGDLRFWAVLALCAGCATSASDQRGPSSASAACESFETFQALRRGAAEAGPAVTDARRACARHAVAGLPHLQLARGGATVQAELDALARALPSPELRAMVEELLGAEAGAVRGMLELAISGAEQERREAQRAPRERASLEAWRPTAETPRPSAGCLGLGGEEQLACLATLKAGAPEADVAATALAVVRERLSALQVLPAGVRAAALGRLFDAVAPLEAEAASAAVANALQATAPEVLAQAKATPSPERAARAVAPLGRVAALREEVARWQAAAAAHQLAQAEAARSSPLAAALHRLVAAGFGGPKAAWPAPLPLDASRSRCERLPPLPALPHGLAGRLMVRCSREARRPQLPQGTEKTFEEEQALKTERIEGDLSLACGGVVSTVRLAVQDVALETGARELGEEPSGAAASLRLKVDAAVAEAGRACSQRHREAQQADCAALPTLEPAAAEQRFAEHALVSGTWASCFKKWFAGRVGDELPALR